jgi:molybdenum cofactor biosynthesis enzyme MoaA
MFPERAYEIGAEGQAKVTRRRSTIEGALKLANAEPQLRGKHYLTSREARTTGRRRRRAVSRKTTQAFRCVASCCAGFCEQVSRLFLTRRAGSPVGNGG